MLSIVVIILGLVADRLTKVWASSSLVYHVNGTLTVIPGFFRFTYLENTGAAFGFLSGHTWILTIVAAIAVALILFELFRLRKGIHKLYNIALSLLLAGALGNLFDRVVSGFVVDFIEFNFINFAVFNVADICVTFGVILLIVYLFVAERIEKKKAVSSASATVTAAAMADMADEQESAFPLLAAKESDPEFERLMTYYQKKESSDGTAAPLAPPKSKPVPIVVREAPKPEPAPAIVPESPKPEPAPVIVPEAPKPAPVPVVVPEEPKPISTTASVLLSHSEDESIISDEPQSMSRMARRAANKKK